MTNKEFMDFYMFVRGKCYLTKIEVENVNRSKVSIEKIFKTISKELRIEKGSEDIIWRCCYGIVKLCNRHKINDKNLNYTLDNIVNLYHNNQISSGKELFKLITDINGRSQLKIDFNLFKVNSISSCKLKVDDKESNFRSINCENEISYLKGKQYDIFAYMLKDERSKIYKRGYNLKAVVKDIMTFDYDKVYISKFRGNDIDYINEIIDEYTSMEDYFNMILALGFIELSLYVNLREFESLRKTKYNLIGIIGTLIKVWDVTDINKIKFLIKLNKQIKNEESLVDLNRVLQMFVDRIRLEHDVLTRILFSDWSSIDELITRLTKIDLKKVYMIVETYDKNDYYMIDNGISYAHITPGNICAREIVIINGDILVKKDSTVIDGGVKIDVDDILLVKGE